MLGVIISQDRVPSNFVALHLFVILWSEVFILSFSSRTDFQLGNILD